MLDAKKQMHSDDPQVKNQWHAGLDAVQKSVAIMDKRREESLTYCNAGSNALKVNSSRCTVSNVKMPDAPVTVSQDNNIKEPNARGAMQPGPAGNPNVLRAQENMAQYLHFPQTISRILDNCGTAVNEARTYDSLSGSRKTSVRRRVLATKLRHARQPARMASELGNGVANGEGGRIDVDPDSNVNLEYTLFDICKPQSGQLDMKAVMNPTSPKYDPLIAVSYEIERQRKEQLEKRKTKRRKRRTEFKSSLTMVSPCSSVWCIDAD